MTEKLRRRIHLVQATAFEMKCLKRLGWRLGPLLLPALPRMRQRR